MLGRTERVMVVKPSTEPFNPCCFAASDVRKLCWMINTTCNLSCKHCAVFDNDFIRDFTGVTCQQDIDDVMTFIQLMDIKSVVVSGGEPTLSPWLVPILKSLRDRRLKFSLSTNATLITDSLILQFINAGLVKATVSFDGATDQTHDQLRGEGAFSKMLSGLRRLIKAGVTITAGVFIREEVIPELPALSRLCAEEGVSKLSLLWPIKQGRYRNLSETLSEKSLQAAALILKDLATCGLDVMVLRPECTDPGCPSGKRIWGAIGGKALPLCVYKGGLLESRSPLILALD